MKTKKEYIIPFIGLKLGFHEFEFEIHDAFFEDRDYSIIHNGNVDVKLVFEKKGTMMIGEFTIAGTVSTQCDRCNDAYEVPVDGQYRLIYTFDTEPSDNETLVVLHPDDYEINLYDSIYELITVSLPSRLVHPKGECNEEMMELLSKYMPQKPENSEEEDEDDWDDEDWDDDEDDGDDMPINPSMFPLKNLN